MAHVAGFKGIAGCAAIRVSHLRGYPTEKNVLRWAEEEIKLLPMALIPRAIHLLRLQFIVSKETAIRMARDFLELAESPREYVKGWWRLLVN
jgi:hypothetical protein